MAQWCNSLTLQSNHSGAVGAIPGRAPPLERLDKGEGARLALIATSAIPTLGAKNCNFTSIGAVERRLNPNHSVFH